MLKDTVNAIFEKMMTSLARSFAISGHAILEKTNLSGQTLQMLFGAYVGDCNRIRKTAKDGLF